MVLRKQLPPREYDTFNSSNASEAGQGSSETTVSTKTDKSGLSAAHEAQRLASQGSWADNIFHTPGTIATPTASTVDGEERREPLNVMGYPSDPPPQYTPTDTTANTAPNSPTTTRAEPVGTSPHPRRPSTSLPTGHEDAEEDQATAESHSPSSPLLERGDQHDDCYPQDPMRWRGDCKKHRMHRCKRIAWFTFAFILCMWIMIPSIFALSKPSTQGPHHPHKPNDDLKDSPLPTWPVPKREYRQHETSKSIHGSFNLYDYLELETTSGSISITVDTKPGDKPAVMRLSTQSGSINLRMAGDSWLPWVPTPQIASNRTFDISLSTSSGSVRAGVLAGNGGTTAISTKSGSHSVTVYTVGAGKADNVTRLSTTSGSGSQWVKVVSSSDHNVTTLRSKHLTTGSASLFVQYPSQWMGKVHAHIDGSGHVSMSGSDLEKQGGGSNIYGWRGEEPLEEVEVYGQGSGSIRFSC